jgi:hypothetical protein
MSPAATTRTPLSAPKPAPDDRAPDDDVGPDGEGGASLPPLPGLHATTSDNAAADTSAPILLRLLTPVNLITPLSSPKPTSG